MVRGRVLERAFRLLNSRLRVLRLPSILSEVLSMVEVDSQTTHFLLLIKVIALFSANQRTHYRLSKCRYSRMSYRAYLRVQLRIKASDDARHEDAAEHFTAAVNFSAFSSKSDIHGIYKDLVLLLGSDLKSLRLTAHKTVWCTPSVGRLQLQFRSGIGLAAISSMETSVEATHGGLHEYVGRTTLFWFLLGIVALQFISISIF